MANMLESPLAPMPDTQKVPYLAFDLSVDRIKNARAAGFNVIYGNGSPHVSRLLKINQVSSLLALQLHLVQCLVFRSEHSTSDLNQL